MEGPKRSCRLQTRTVAGFRLQPLEIENQDTRLGDGYEVDGDHSSRELNIYHLTNSTRTDDDIDHRYTNTRNAQGFSLGPFLGGTWKHGYG